MDKSISKKMSIYIISITVILLITLGSVIGYTFFWNQYDRTPSSEKKVSQIQEQVILKPDDKSNLMDLGWTYYQQGKFNEAKQQFDKILKLDKDDYDARYGKASSYIGLQKYDNAEKLLLQLLEEKPGDAEVLHSLGIVEREQGRYEEAEQTLLAALKINRISSDILYDLALVYEKLNKKEQAITYFKRSVDFVPDFKEALDGLKRLGVESYTPEVSH